MTRLILATISLFCFVSNSLAASTDHFVTTWKTDNPGTSNDTSITVPMIGGPYDVDWNNDGTFDEFGLSGSVTHDFLVADTYTIRIQGTYNSIGFYIDGDKEKILSLDQWGTNSWITMDWAFAGAVNLTIPAPDTPDFSAVTNMAAMFYGAVSANPDTSGWDTSAVTTMLGMFANAASVNPDTSSWNTSAVTDMAGMFASAVSVNPDTSGWDTTKVTNMSDMFFNATSANPDTSGWDTSTVTNMAGMFSAAEIANPDTSGWDTSAVTDMSRMFGWANLANPDVSGWDTSSVTNMSSMFNGATSYDRDIGAWDVKSLTDAANMFGEVNLSLGNYESLLIGWNAQNLQPGVTFSGGNSVYCSAPAVTARANMIASDSWVITDGGNYCPPTSPGSAPDLTPATDTGAFDNDDITTDSTPAFYVACSVPGNVITLYTDNPVVNTEIGERLCRTVGIETATSTTALDVGIHNISYTDRIGGAESGHSPSLQITIDPPVPTDEFVTTWQTANPGTSGPTSIIVPMVGGPYEVDWDNDGVFDESGLYDAVTHDFGVANTYTIRIRGGFSSIRFDHGGDGEKILTLDQWGTHSWTSMTWAFAGATNLTLPATDNPDFSAVTSMYVMFYDAISANPNTSSWDTSSVTDMAFMFFLASSANPDTSSWNTSAVTDMGGMFANATSANPDTSSWDTSAVVDMGGMFQATGSVNPNTSGWDTSAVINMYAMFWFAPSANPDISGWDTSSVTDMAFMFQEASSFDRDIGLWDVSSLSNAESMFDGIALSTPNYDSLLEGWGAQTLQSGVTFSGGNSTYCSAAASAARANMIASDNWAISDSGKVCPLGYSCNVNTISAVTEYSDPIHEACEILILGPDFTAADGSNVSVSSGWEIGFMPGFRVEQGATLDAVVCGQSLCLTSPDPMPYGCHTCVDLICDSEPSCCGVEFSQTCVDKVNSVCGLVCE